MILDSRIAVEERYALEAEEMQWRGLTLSHEWFDVQTYDWDLERLEVRQMVPAAQLLEGLDNGGLLICGQRFDIINVRVRNPESMYSAFTPEENIGIISYR
jgi:hypothetical protein